LLGALASATSAEVRVAMCLQEGSMGVAVVSAVKDLHQTQQPTKEQISQCVPHKYGLTIMYTVLLPLHLLSESESYGPLLQTWAHEI